MKKVNKYIRNLALCSMFLIAGAASFSPNIAVADMEEGKSGKWVGVYAGGSEIHHCECASSLLRSQCMVGDTSTNTTLCD